MANPPSVISSRWDAFGMMHDSCGFLLAVRVHIHRLRRALAVRRSLFACLVGAGRAPSAAGFANGVRAVGQRTYSNMQC